MSFSKSCFFFFLKWLMRNINDASKGKWAAPFENHTPPVENLPEVVHRGSMNFRWIDLLGFSTWDLGSGSDADWGSDLKTTLPLHSLDPDRAAFCAAC